MAEAMTPMTIFLKLPEILQREGAKRIEQYHSIMDDFHATLAIGVLNTCKLEQARKFKREGVQLYELGKSRRNHSRIVEWIGCAVGFGDHDEGDIAAMALLFDDGYPAPLVKVLAKSIRDEEAA